MRSQELGFVSSWKMLTRDKGWLKPLLVLTLVSWIPILGQIAVCGYALEWARLTAWGVDSAPKQKGVDYGKVLTTGGIAFLVALSMGMILALLNFILFRGIYVGTAFPMGMSTAIFGDTTGRLLGSAFGGGFSLLSLLLMMVMNILFGSFITAAMLRSTLYDSFFAGWRVDRLLQMVVSDLGGFLHTYAVSLIGGLVSWASTAVVTVLGAIIAFGGLAGMVYSASSSYLTQDFFTMLTHIGPVPVLCVLILAVVALFAVQVVGIAMQLVGINAMGQWFWRFDVSRWGVSSAPLPDGVPRGSHGPAVSQSGTPTSPASSAAGPKAQADSGPRHEPGPRTSAQAPSSPAGSEPEKKPIPLGPISGGRPDSDPDAETRA